MTINYTLSACAEIVFDGDFHYVEMADSWHSLTDYIEKATHFMGEYNFMTAAIIDTETHEVLVEMERDANDCYPDDDDLPEYYDDGDTCGYE